VQGEWTTLNALRRPSVQHPFGFWFYQRVRGRTLLILCDPIYAWGSAAGLLQPLYAGNGVFLHSFRRPFGGHQAISQHPNHLQVII
jgi:hypothetical protein